MFRLRDLARFARLVASLNMTGLSDLVCNCRYPFCQSRWDGKIPTSGKTGQKWGTHRAEA
jgi:hypothetical protein